MVSLRQCKFDRRRDREKFFKPNCISTPLQQYEVNRLARKARHEKVFSGAVPFNLPKTNFLPKGLIAGGNSIKSALLPGLHHKKADTFDSNSAANILFKKYSAMVAVIFIAGSISPVGTSAEVYLNEFTPYASTEVYEGGILADDDGYLTKLNPQTSQTDRSGLSDKYTHKVESGETLSTIAMSYGLKTETVMWENGLANANSLKVGQELIIPPVDGISHKISKGETLEKVATKYNVEIKDISKQNNLIAANVAEGDEVFIPGAKPIATETRTTPARVSTSTRVAVGTPVALAGSTSSPVGAKPLIMPTRGALTQGFHKGHYAYDIADRSMPPIWAAGGGKVTKASSGTWGGGYGNHVIIDHGNGLQTLYAHMDYLTVSVGDVVDQGEVIGRMGRTGRVYGVTGIHLHFEVIKNGVKQVPSDYY